MERLRHKLTSLIQLILVILFILFEEVVWEGIAKPIYAWVHGLRVLQKIQLALERVPAWIILVLFVVLLVGVELLGLYAGALFVSGYVLTGAMIYGAKIPIAAFTFWLFKVSKPRLMEFAWFAWVYEKTMALIERLKSWPVYVETMALLKRTRHRVKAWIRELKARYFAKESRFVRGMKRFYRVIKKALRRQ